METRSIRKLEIVNKKQSFLVLLALFASALNPFALPAHATTAESYDFNTVGQLANNFDTLATSGYSQSTTGGIGNSGAINAPNSLDAVFASKNSYSLGSSGSTYTFSSLMKSVGNGGYSGMGFSATPATQSGVPYRPNDALGISVHGGGFVFHNGATDYSSNWNLGSTGSITAVRSASINDLLNSGSADQWYKVIFTITYSGSNTFTMRVEVWPAYGTDGTVRNTANADAIFEVRNITNSTIGTAPTLKSYINFSGYRVTYFDNFQVDLGGNASVVAAGNPVVLTNASTVTSNQITFNGNVTSENGSPVTERGFVYGTSPNPTLSDTKISNGTSTGTFTSTTPTLGVGTYYVRAFATNSTGTSYGAQVQTDIVGAPTLTWAPTNTSVLLSAGSVTPSVAATSNSSGAISYAVQNAGTTNCTVNSSTGVVTYTAAGDCVIRATVAAASPYSSGTLDKTFTISSITAPSAPTSVLATAGNSSASVSWTAPGSNGGSAITSYTVTASPGGATCIVNAPATSCTVSGLANGTSYTFSAVATNTAGNSVSSSSSSAVTPSAPVSGGSPNPVPEVPDTRVQSIQLTNGKTAGSSSVKLKLSNSVKSVENITAKIRLIGITGKVIKELEVPLTENTNEFEVSLPISLGAYSVEANIVNAAGLGTKVVSSLGQIVNKKYFTRISKNVQPILDGTKLGNPIVFAPNSTKLTSTAKVELRKLVEVLKESNFNIALTGFSAPAGAPTSVALSIAQKRSSAVAKFLYDNGVRNWIFKSGYGVLPFSQSVGSPRKVELRILNQ